MRHGNKTSGVFGFEGKPSFPTLLGWGSEMGGEIERPFCAVG